MNREERLERITQLVSEREIHTQEELQELLIEQGLNVTQATISRDIHSLKLVKVPSKGGKLKYGFQVDTEHLSYEKLRHKLVDALVSLEAIQYFVMVKTLPGHAHSFGALLDSMEIPGKAGTICGNDTCLIICRSPEMASKIKHQLEVYSE